jgi:hypothetical protein
MKFPSVLKSLSVLDVILLVVFLLYLVLPIQTPKSFAPFIDTPFGYLVMFCITIYLFLLNPILGVMYVLVAYEILRRTSAAFAGNGNRPVGDSLVMRYALEPNSQFTQEFEVPPPPTVSSEPMYSSGSLEEHMVASMAPIGVSPENPIVESGFGPVAEKIGGASFV